MKNKLLTLAIIATFTSNLYAFTSYSEYASNWKVYAGGKSNATITESTDEDDNKVIFKGRGIKSGYILGSIKSSDRGAWHNKREQLLSLNLKTENIFTIYVPIETSNGLRFLTYTNHPDHINKRGKEGSFIYVGLTAEEQKSNSLKNIKRNLLNDLQKYEPNNKIVEINALMVRGDMEINSVSLDSIQSTNDKTVYENGSNVSKWRVYAGGKSNAKIGIRYHADLGESLRPMISLKGDGIKSGYMIGSVNGADAWHNSTQSILKISIMHGGIYTFYVPIKTTQGLRFLTYTTHPDHNKKRGKEGKFIYLPINNTKGSAFEYFTRDLKSDLARYEPNNKLLEVNGLMVRGSLYISNVYLEKNKKSQLLPPFNMDKFNQLLEDKKRELETRGYASRVDIHHPAEANARSIAWIEQEEADQGLTTVALYSTDGTKLQLLHSIHWNCLEDYNMKFLENNSLLLMDASIDFMSCSSAEETTLFDLHDESNPYLIQYGHGHALD